MKRVLLPLLVVLLAACAPQVAPTPADSPAPAATAAPPAVPSPAATAAPPAASPAPAPSPSPKSAVTLVVYAREDALWAYDGQAARLLPTGGPAGEPLLSPDGRRVLYRRPETPTELTLEPFSLWLLDLATGAETAVDLASLPPYPFDLEGRSLVFPRQPRLAAWMPDSQALLFNTVVDLTAFLPGRILSDDLWQVDAATGAVQRLFPEESPPASFTIGPDGTWLLVNRPTRIEAVNLVTGARRTLLEFPFVLTYSDYAWLPEPRWRPDGRTADVAIAPADPMRQDATFALWRLDVEEGRAEQFGEVEGMAFAWSPDGRSWSPDGAHLAYVSSGEGPRQVTVLALDASPGGVDSVVLGAVVLGEALPRILGWTPDGQTVLVQAGAELYGLQAGPGLESRLLLTAGPQPVKLWYGLGGGVLFSTGAGQLFELNADGRGIRPILD